MDEDKETPFLPEEHRENFIKNQSLAMNSRKIGRRTSEDTYKKDLLKGARKK